MGRSSATCSGPERPLLPHLAETQSSHSCPSSSPRSHQPCHSQEPGDSQQGGHGLCFLTLQPLPVSLPSATPRLFPQSPSIGWHPPFPSMYRPSLGGWAPPPRGWLGPGWAAVLRSHWEPLHFAFPEPQCPPLWDERGSPLEDLGWSCCVTSSSPAWDIRAHRPGRRGPQGAVGRPVESERAGAEALSRGGRRPRDGRASVSTCCPRASGRGGKPWAASPAKGGGAHAGFSHRPRGQRDPRLRPRSCRPARLPESASASLSAAGRAGGHGQLGDTRPAVGQSRPQIGLHAKHPCFPAIMS